MMPLEDMPKPESRLSSGALARARLVEIVGRQPGVHKSQLCRLSGLGWGTVSYHLRLLEQARQLQTVTSERETRVFPAGVPQEQLKALAALRATGGSAIAKIIREHPGMRQGEICQALGASRKLIRRHLHVLHREGLVNVEGSRRARYLPTPALDDLLGPSLPEPGGPAPV